MRIEGNIYIYMADPDQDPSGTWADEGDVVGHNPVPISSTVPSPVIDFWWSRGNRAKLTEGTSRYVGRFGGWGRVSSVRQVYGWHHAA